MGLVADRRPVRGIRARGVSRGGVRLAGVPAGPEDAPAGVVHQGRRAESTRREGSVLDCAVSTVGCVIELTLRACSAHAQRRPGRWAWRNKPDGTKARPRAPDSPLHLLTARPAVPPPADQGVQYLTKRVLTPHTMLERRQPGRADFLVLSGRDDISPTWELAEHVRFF